MAAKTVAEQIKALREKAIECTKKADALAAAEKAAAALADLKPGDEIQYMYGRGETRGKFFGEVRAVFDTDKGKGIKVIKGSGADEEIVTIRPGDIVSIGAEVAEAAAPSGNVAPADPLADIQ